MCVRVCVRACVRAFPSHQKLNFEIAPSLKIRLINRMRKLSFILNNFIKQAHLSEEGIGVKLENLFYKTFCYRNFTFYVT